MNNEQSEESRGREEPSEDFVVDFIKSNYFRMVYAEGFWGGTSGEGNITLAFWNSREAIPKQMRFRVDEAGEVELVGRTERADQIREVEVGVIMSTECARMLRSVLDDLILEAEEGNETPEGERLDE